MKVKCKCGKRFEIKLSDLGMTKQCPHCGKKVKLPDKSAVARHQKKKSATSKPSKRSKADKDDEGYQLENPQKPDVASKKDLSKPEAAAKAGKPPTPGTMKLCTQCGKVVTDDSPVCQECGGELKSLGEGLKAEPEKKTTTTYSASPNLPQLIYECIRHPSQISGIGLGGTFTPSFFVQLGVAFLLLVFVPTTMAEIGEGGFKEIEFLDIVLKTGLKIGSFGAVVLSLWIMAKMFSSNATFVSILGGLAFIRVLVISLLLVLLLVVGLVGGASAIGILPTAVALSLLAVAGLVYGVLTFVIQMYFIMGLFDVGCLGAFFMNAMAGFIAGFIQLYVAGIVMQFAT